MRQQAPIPVGRKVEESDSVMTAEKALKLALRLFGSSSLLALVFVVAPRSWMDFLHAASGMGRLPDGPVVGYLARSTSAFYALTGGLFWVASFDLARHRRVLTYLGRAIAAFGVVLLAVDQLEGLPPLWAVWEGPVVAALGVSISLLIRRVSPRTSSARQGSGG